jgi:hypothetical protein
VSLLPFDRMAAMTWERFFFEKTSAIVSGAHSTEVVSRLKARPLRFVCFAVTGRGKVEFLVGPTSKCLRLKAKC